jgi:hypothetical protein
MSSVELSIQEIDICAKWIKRRHSVRDNVVCAKWRAVEIAVLEVICTGRTAIRQDGVDIFPSLYVQVG